MFVGVVNDTHKKRVRIERQGKSGDCSAMLLLSCLLSAAIDLFIVIRQNRDSGMSRFFMLHLLTSITTFAVLYNSC